MEINVFSGLEVHCVRPHYQQNDFVIGFSLHSVKTLLLAAEAETTGNKRWELVLKWK